MVRNHGLVPPSIWFLALDQCFCALNPDPRACAGGGLAGVCAREGGGRGGIGGSRCRRHCCTSLRPESTMQCSLMIDLLTPRMACALVLRFVVGGFAVPNCYAG